MRLTDKTHSGQMRISSSKCSPSGELREAVRGQNRFEESIIMSDSFRDQKIRNLERISFFNDLALIGTRETGGRKNYEARHFSFLPPLTPPAPAPPRGSLSDWQPSAAGDHHPALSVQGTHEEKGKIDNRAPPFRVLKGWPRSGRVSSSFVQGTNEANCQKVPGKNEIIHKQVLSLWNTATAVRGQNRFEESIISVCFPLKFPVASSHSPLSLLRSQLPQGVA